MKVTWFRHHHESRNDLLRFGMMRLHYGGDIRYRELPLAEAGRAGFSPAVVNHPDPRHLSFLLVENGRSKRRCLVDNEDSFALITPLISEADVCFCAGYNADFFENRQFVKPYAWQNETDISWYRNVMEEKIYAFGNQFKKVKRFIPIAPNQGTPPAVPAWKQKVNNIASRLNRMAGKGAGFGDVYGAFEARDAVLKDYRRCQLAYDVVLNDSLWGWPQHRINLHRRLQELQHKGRRIHSVLNWTAPSACDGSDRSAINPAALPITTLPINQPYESMMAQSRLAVFACGFHWGWRNIMMFALSTGLPVLTDRLLTEAYFDMNEFHLYQQENHEWAGVEATLREIDDESWQRIKYHNQSVYDKYMQPEAVARYVLDAVERS